MTSSGDGAMAHSAARRCLSRASAKMLPMAKDPMKWDGKVYRQVRFGDSLFETE